MKIDRETDALLIVDFQNDFVTGSLAVDGAEELVPVINKYVEKFKNIILSRDRHKPGHPSFVAQGGPWPDHCVDGTAGMSIHSGIVYPDGVQVALVDKGWDEEAYSPFEKTNLSDMLKDIGARRLFICGLATDYCVKATALDARKGFNGPVYLLTDAIAAVNINPGDGNNALKEMTDKGVIATLLGGNKV